jgi:hypothetical protein
MTVIVEFRHSRERAAARTSRPATPPNALSAEIVIFPGVRVERHDDRTVPGGQGSTGRTRRPGDAVPCSAGSADD